MGEACIYDRYDDCPYDCPQCPRARYEAEEAEFYDWYGEASDSEMFEMSGDY